MESVPDFWPFGAPGLSQFPTKKRCQPKRIVGVFSKHHFLTAICHFQSEYLFHVHTFYMVCEQIAMFHQHGKPQHAGIAYVKIYLLSPGDDFTWDFPFSPQVLHILLRLQQGCWNLQLLEFPPATAAARKYSSSICSDMGDSHMLLFVSWESQQYPTNLYKSYFWHMALNPLHH